MSKKIIDDSKAISRRNFIKTSVVLGGLSSVAILGGESFMTSAASGFERSGFRTKEQFDTIISNGLVYCGDGKAPLKADLGLKDGKISAIGKLGKSCREFIDAKGQAVSPGFIDIHTHTDTNLLEAPLGDSRLFQGVTSDIAGNCGGSPFPYSDAEYEAGKNTKPFGYPFWKNVDGFYDALRKNTIGINFKSYTGQGTLRHVVVGDNNVPCTPDQLKQMCYLLDQQIEMGSIGLSFGLEYTPGSYGSREEFVELLKVVAKNNALYAIHMRNEDDRVEEAITEAIGLARDSGARLEISHLKAQNEANWGKVPNMLKLIDDAVAGGMDICFDRYPYTAFSTGMTSFIPLNERQGSDAEILERLKDPVKSKAIGEYALSRIKRLGGPHCVLVAACFTPGNEKYSGKFIDECCTLSGMDVWPMIQYLLVSEKLGVQIAGFAMKESNLRAILNHPLAMVASDGSVYSPNGRLGTEMPHPRSYGTFPNYLGKYVRDEKFCDLQTAIYKCTGLPAHQLRLKNRGLLEVGYAADVVVFNTATIADIATYAKPHQFPRGIEHVFVNGAHEISGGKYTGCKLAGVIL